MRNARVVPNYFHPCPESREGEKAFFTFKRVPTQPLLHRDAIFRTSRRSHRYVGTQFQMHREGVKNTENPGCNSERCTFRFVKYLPVVFGIVNFLPVCASTV